MAESLLQGTSLTDYLGMAVLQPADALSICSQICAELIALHRAGSIPGVLSSAAIGVRRSESGVRAWIADLDHETQASPRAALGEAKDRWAHVHGAANQRGFPNSTTKHPRRGSVPE